MCLSWPITFLILHHFYLKYCKTPYWPLDYLIHLASRDVFLKYTSSHIVIPLFRISPCLSAFLTRTLGKFPGLEPGMH